MPKRKNLNTPQQENLPTIPQEKKIDTTPKYTDPEKIRELITGRGMTQAEAGKILGISREAVGKMCRRHGIMTRNALKIFKNQRADILSAKQAQLIYSIDDEDIKKVSAFQKAGMFGLFYDKERLERGKTTENVGYADYTDALSEVNKQIAVLEDETPADGGLETPFYGAETVQGIETNGKD